MSTHYTIITEGPLTSTRVDRVESDDDEMAAMIARGILAELPAEHAPLRVRVYRARGCEGLVLVATEARYRSAT